jgi:aminomethyltransferase
MQKSPVFDFLTGLGCQYVELPPAESLPGTFVPSHFGDPVAEARAIREGVVAWDCASTCSYEWRGRDAVLAFQRVFSNDVTSLRPGRGRYGMILNANGNVLVDPIAFKMSETHMFATTGEGVYLDYYCEAACDLDVEIEWVAPRFPHIQVQGPKSRDLLQSLTRFDMSSMRWFDITTERVELADCPVLISRTGPTAELGFEVFYHREDGERLYRALIGGGATPIGHDCIVGILKPELGAICDGVDYLNGNRTPYDLSMDRFVALHKPIEFAGKERLRKIAESPPRRFVTLELKRNGTTAGELPEWGSRVFAADREAGLMTCSAESPQFGPLAQAIVETEFADEGRSLMIRSGEAEFTATVTTTPLYEPDRIKVRS